MSLGAGLDTYVVSVIFVLRPLLIIELKMTERPAVRERVPFLPGPPIPFDTCKKGWMLTMYGIIQSTDLEIFGPRDQQVMHVDVDLPRAIGKGKKKKNQKKKKAFAHCPPLENLTDRQADCNCT